MKDDASPLPNETSKILDDVFAIEPETPPTPPAPAPAPTPPPPAAPAKPAEPPEPPPGPDFFEEPAAPPPPPPGDTQDAVIRRLAFEKREAERKAKEATAKLQEVEEKYTKTEERLGQVSLQESEAFRKRYDQPIQEARNRILQEAMRSGVFANQEDATRFVQVLFQAQTAREREDLVSDHLASAPSVVQGAILTRLEDVQDSIRTRAQALEKWKETRNAVDETLEAERFQAESARMVSALQTAVDGAKTSGNPVWVRAQGENLTRLVDATTVALRDRDPATLATLVAQGVTVPHLVAALDKTYRELVALRAESAARAGDGSPRPSNAGPPANSAPPAAPKTTEQVLDSMFPRGPNDPQAVFL